MDPDTLIDDRNGRNPHRPFWNDRAGPKNAPIMNRIADVH